MSDRSSGAHWREEAEHICWRLCRCCGKREVQCKRAALRGDMQLGARCRPPTRIHLSCLSRLMSWLWPPARSLFSNCTALIPPSLHTVVICAFTCSSEGLIFPSSEVAAATSVRFIRLEVRMWGKPHGRCEQNVLYSCVSSV